MKEKQKTNGDILHRWKFVTQLRLRSTYISSLFEILIPSINDIRTRDYIFCGPVLYNLII